MLENFEDIHSHNFLGEKTIRNVFPRDIEKFIKQYPHQPISVGIHPWFISNDWEQDFLLIEKYAQSDLVIAIGETGLDKKCKISFELQQHVFKHHILLSEKLQKTLILHIVSAYSELLHFKKKYKPKQQWIIHGFRGNDILAKQLINNNIHISLGEYHNPKTLKFLKQYSFFTETDESQLSIKEIKEKMNIKGIS